MSLSIAKDFRFFSLLHFTLPTIIMMIFTSLYTIIDGIFVSRFIGSNALSSINIVFPSVNLVIGIGFMIASGGSALIAKKIGMYKEEEANQDFSFLICIGFFISVLILCLGNLFLEPLVHILGATEVLKIDCMKYLGILLFFSPAFILQLLFQPFFVAVGKPGIGLALTILGGISNIIFDYILIVLMNMGIAGAALATGIGQLLPAVFGLIYFLFRKHQIRLVKPVIRWKTFFQSCANGFSEMVTNLSTAIVTFLFNIVMLRLVGEDGVAAMTIVLYGQFLFNALYLGFSMGVAPIISYNYGRQNILLLRRIFKICIWFVSISSILATAMALLLSPIIVTIFTPHGNAIYELANVGFFLFSFNYLFASMNIFASSMFTAFSDGLISAIISFARTFVFLVGSILILPEFFGVTGVWISVPVAEAITLLLSIFFLYIKRYKYQYAGKHMLTDSILMESES